MRNAGSGAARFLLGISVAIAPSAQADDTWLTASGVALHLDGRSHCNSVTTGLGVERVHSEVSRGLLGVYRNSNCAWSGYAAECWLPISALGLRAGACAGAVTGYGRPITPAGGIGVTLERKTWGLNLLYVPPVGGSGNVLWLNAKVPW